MSLDVVTYLNRESPEVAEVAPFYSKLKQAIAESKQARAPAPQWLSMIKALTQKGVKQIEMEEAAFLPWLDGQTDVLTKEQLLHEISRRYYTIKEVVLGSPKYSTYRQPEGLYREYLYIANSERGNVEDEIEEIEWQMEELSFDPEKLAEDPGIALRLERQRAELMKSKDETIEFTQHHFSDKLELGKHGKNLLAHARVTVRGEIYFIEEIQSDWAQRGRASDWRHIPKGPLVTNTEAWAGMVLRRHLQLAARTPGVKRIAWITESMRNGGRQNLAAEKAKVEQRDAYRGFVAKAIEEKLAAFGDMSTWTKEQVQAAKDTVRKDAEAAANRAGLVEPQDMLNDFYLTVVPKLVDKALGKSGGKTTFTQLTLAQSTAAGSYGSNVVPVPNTVTVPSVEFTPEVMKHLQGQQPMYSRMSLRHSWQLEAEVDHAAYSRALASAREMLGSAKHVRFAKHVFDIATGRKVAGRYVNSLIQISLLAKDVERETRHECFHFAVDHLFSQYEIGMVRAQFAPGTELNWRVRDLLVKAGEYDAAAQCDDPEEAAAHAFTMWEAGELSVAERPVQRLFGDLVSVVKDVVRWFRRTVFDQKCTTVEELFEALASGEMARRDGAERAHVEAAAHERASEALRYVDAEPQRP